jgi:hypothetical protein
VTETSATITRQSSFKESQNYKETQNSNQTDSVPIANDTSPSLSQQTSIEVTNEIRSNVDDSNIENSYKRTSMLCDTNNVGSRDDVVNVNEDDRQPLVGTQSPNLVSKMESGPNSTSVYLAMTSSPCPRSPYTEEEEDEDDDEEEENLSLTSPGTPCSQCLRDEEEATTQAASLTGDRRPASGNFRKKFFNGSHFVGDAEQQSSEECCSIESGSLCCNSSCCEEHHLVGVTRKSGENRGKRISQSEEANLGQPSNGDSSLRQLVTYVTPGLETVPLEMCQDIPDVLI